MSIFNRPRVEPTPLPPTAYEEAHDTCIKLGVDLDMQHAETLSVADFVRLAYAEGWRACESRLASRDVADGIAQALELPESILERKCGESDHGWKVRAVQQVVSYGVPK